ncbi:MAG: hypothetical protein DRN04_13800 [Thermoprotei archaeon]|nr:MAG: hypothetical protein DRN04_13800 [Thermoprotei archaeon]
MRVVVKPGRWRQARPSEDIPVSLLEKYLRLRVFLERMVDEKTAEVISAYIYENLRYLSQRELDAVASMIRYRVKHWGRVTLEEVVEAVEYFKSGRKVTVRVALDKELVDRLREISRGLLFDRVVADLLWKALINYSKNK